MTSPGETRVRRLGPGDEEVVRELERLAQGRGIREGFALTEPGNEPALRLYASLGGERVDSVMWDFAYA